MPIAELALFLGFALAAGVMIGCVGVGGVILVPLLAYAGGVPIHTAIAAAMAAYLVSGAIGTYVFAKNKSIRWDMTAALWLGAMPAALAGALAASLAPAALLEACIGTLTCASGLNSILSKAKSESDDETASIGKPALAAIGGVTGFLSALTGTGGPLVLIPILMWLQIPVLTAIGLSQAIQLPIAVLATGGNAYAGTLDIQLGLILGAGISLGTWAGARLAHMLPKATLRLVVSALLVAVGGLILAKALFTAVSGLAG